MMVRDAVASGAMDAHLVAAAMVTARCLRPAASGDKQAEDDQRSDYCLVDAMPTSMPVVNDTMTNVQRIAVRMIVKKQWTLLWFYSRICSAAIELLQILKGRRKAC